MASVQTSSYGGRYLKLTVTEESTSIENNTSTVKWVLESIGGSSNYYNIYSCEVKINNVTKYGPVTKTWESREFPAAKGSTSGTVDIEHNSDGTANPLQFSLRGSVYNNNPQTYSGTLTLSTIPRASSITVNDANIGSATNIVINKASSGFTTTLYYKASGQSNWTKIVDKTTNQVYGWTVPTSFYNLIPNAKTISCQFYAETYSGNTLIGTSATVTATFTATGNPIINSFTLVDINSITTTLTGDSSKMIRYASNVRATITASGQNSASISSIKVNGTTASDGIVNFNAASTNSFQVVVTDSRGYTTSQTKTMTMIDYVPLTINATIKRNTPTDGKVNISFSGNYFNSSFGSQSNTLTVQYRSIEKGGSWTNVQWNNLTVTLNGNTYSGNAQLSGYTYTNQYEFQIRAVDEIQTKTIIGITVSKGQPIFWWDDDGLNVTQKLNINTGLIFNNSIPSGAGGYGNFRFLPKTRYNTIPDATTDAQVFFKALLKWICNTYSSDVDFVYYGVAVPNGRGPIIIHIYDNNMKDDTTGLPQYCEGMYVSLADRIYHFGTNSYGWYWYQQARTSDIPTSLSQFVNDAGFITSSSLPSITQGTVTITKNSGYGIITGTPSYAKYGNVVHIFFQFYTSGGSTSAGSNVFEGTISGVNLPKLTEATGIGYYGSSGYVVTIVNDGTMRIRVISGTLSVNSDVHGVSITYICS